MVAPYRHRACRALPCARPATEQSRSAAGGTLPRAAPQPPGRQGMKRNEAGRSGTAPKGSRRCARGKAARGKPPDGAKKQKAPEVSLRGLPFYGGGALLSRSPSTIGAAGLNFPVRNGKGWIPRATAALPYDCHRHRRKQHVLHRTSSSIFHSRKAFGVLVPLGFAIADFAPAAYQRRRLRRP